MAQVSHLHACASLGIPEPDSEVIGARQNDITLGMPLCPLYGSVWAFQHVLALPCGCVPYSHFPCQHSTA